MTRESMTDLSQNVLVGFNRKAWHFGMAGTDHAASLANHFEGRVPEQRVRELFADADAESVPLVALVDGQRIEVPGKAAIVRKDRAAVYSVMSDSYAVHNGGELLDGCADVLTDSRDSDALGIATAGLLEKGAVQFVTISLADSAVTASGVEYVTYLLAFGSANGKHASTWKLVNQLVVCDNTLDIARGEKTAQFKVKHTSNSLARIGNAREALGIIIQGQSDFDAKVMELCNTTVTDQQLWKMIDLVAPAPAEGTAGRGATLAQNKRDRFAQLRFDGRVAPWANTAFGWVQMVNTYGHWFATGTGTGDKNERNLGRVLTGDAAKLDTYALDVLDLVLSNQ